MGERTHWDECWRDPAHHGCAVGQVEKWKSKYSRLAGDYAEEAAYLRKRAERAEDIAKSVRTGAPLYDMLEQRNAAITRAEQAEAEVERLRAVVDFAAPHHPDCKSHYAFMVDGICAPGEIKRPRSVQCECDCWKAAALAEVQS